MSEPTIDRRLDTLERFRGDVAGEMKQIRKTLYGNGEPGWDEMLRDILRRLTAVEAKMNEAKTADKDLTLGKMKLTAEMRMGLINGAFVLFGILLTWWLHR